MCKQINLNKTVQFYSPEFASLLQGENTASIDESREKSGPNELYNFLNLTFWFPLSGSYSSPSSFGISAKNDK